jgi:hypothetical protein
VDVSDWVFDPDEVSLGRGGTVIFDFSGPTHHTATDATGMGLYDSGFVGPGGPSTWFTFTAAGGYRFTCTPHPNMGGQVDVPMRVSPSRGSLKKTYSVVWSSITAPDGFVFDVQLKRPRHDWKYWMTGMTRRSGSFKPNTGRGTYRFRARMRSLTGGQAYWSDAALIRVG